MIVRVARGVHSADGGTFDVEYLAVDNGLLGSAGSIFVDRVIEVRIKPEEVGDAARVVTVPVGEQYVREGHFRGGERRGDQVGPFWDALGGVDDESFGASAYNVGICALKCELATT